MINKNNLPKETTVKQPNYKLSRQKTECNATSWKHVESSMPSMNRSVRW